MPKILSGLQGEPEFRPRPAKGASVFVCENAFRDMADHADRGLEEGVEIMGLMMGSLYRDDLGTYAVVTDTATAGLESSESSVRFDKDSFEELFESMDGSDGELVVGWYHSHPGFGCYMSDTDLRTHTGIFGGDTGFALVIDPSDGTAKMFTCENGAQADAPMVILE